MQILLIEDDKRISNFLIKGLEENGHFVTLCKTAEEMLASYLQISFDIIICDIMLPGMDGMQLIQTLRYKKIYTPILMLTALGTVQDKINALDFGADDYLTKPFHFDELLARINALTRRNQYAVQEERSSVVQYGHLIIDLEQYQVKIDHEDITLSPKEFKLLAYLIDNANKAVSRIQILNAVWGISFENHTNVVDVYISYLRNKIETKERYILTVKGVGYMFKLEE
ncbi:response regulator transcription factor [Faecalibacter rhinopitheci]|uniref:Response regulator transcription factor n=1 Tax=Faecalibacter rhinopitheci TaxID=2779678 RepID=A0A8J7FLA2_9FLAO|nr:response regulator transcription factor [Faecalibacter rhinopitheci]MBF0596422.1 response regulator transcription factor [Faecalibacter rhinopitheci]